MVYKSGLYFLVSMISCVTFEKCAASLVMPPATPSAGAVDAALAAGSVSLLLQYTRMSDTAGRVFIDRSFLTGWGNDLFVRAAREDNVAFVKSFLRKFHTWLADDTIQQAYQAAGKQVKNFLVATFGINTLFVVGQKLKDDFYAAITGSADAVQAFLEGFTTAERTELISSLIGPDRKEPLVVAIDLGNYAVIEALINAGAVVDMTAVKRAVNTGNIIIFRVVLQAYLSQNRLLKKKLLDDKKSLEQTLADEKSLEQTFEQTLLADEKSLEQTLTDEKLLEKLRQKILIDKTSLEMILTAEESREETLNSGIDDILSYLCLSDAPESVTMMRELSRQIMPADGLQLAVDLVWKAMMRTVGHFAPKVLPSLLAVEKIDLLFSLGFAAHDISHDNLKTMIDIMMISYENAWMGFGGSLYSYDTNLFSKLMSHLTLAQVNQVLEMLVGKIRAYDTIMGRVLGSAYGKSLPYTELPQLAAFLRTCINAGATVNEATMDTALLALYDEMGGGSFFTGFYNKIAIKNYLDIAFLLLSRTTLTVKNREAALVALLGADSPRDRFRASLFPLLVRTGVDLTGVLIALPQLLYEHVLPSRVYSGNQHPLAFGVKNLIAAGAQVTGDAAVQDGKSVLSELLRNYATVELTDNQRNDLEQALDIVLNHGARLTTDQQADPVLRHAAHQFLQNAGDKIVNTQLLLYAQQLGDEAEIARLTQRITQARSRGIGARVQRLLGGVTKPAEEQQRQGGGQDMSNGHAADNAPVYEP